MPKRVIDPDDSALEAIQMDILAARKWARKRFPEEPKGIFQQGFKVEFPAPDKMTVWATAYGEVMWGSEAHFTLVWQDRKIFWRGNFALREAIFNEHDLINHEVGPANWIGVSDAL